MTPDREIEFALDILRERLRPIAARKQQGVYLTPIEVFLAETIPALENLLRASYDAFHDVLFTEENFEQHHTLELELARAILRSKPDGQ